MDCPSSSPDSGLRRCHNNQMHKDLVLNMSPRPPRLRNITAHVKETCVDKTFDSWDINKKQSFDSNTPPISDSKATYKSSADLVREIAILEVEIIHLERYLLSLYRKAFKQHIPRISEDHVEQINGTSEMIKSDQPSPKIKIGKSEENKVRLSESSSTSSLAGPNNFVQIAIPNFSYGREKQCAYPEPRSLGDHLRNSCTDEARICPGRLSEDIVRCISLIYCKVSNHAFTYKRCSGSGSSTSSFCSSSTFSPRNLSGSWSPQCNEDVTENCDFEGLKQETGPYASMIEVLKISLDDETYSYAANMLQKFRSLVKSLETVDPTKMWREEKLAFWINIHNALVMHAHLAYGTRNYIKGTSVLKGSYNVGGHCVNAYDIQSSIFGIRSHYSARWLSTLLSSGKKLKTPNTKHVYAIEYSEPLVHFALCWGVYSDPAVRVYTANNVFHDLNVAKEEFIQATVYVHKQTKIYLPRILCYYAKDMSMGLAELLEVVIGCLPAIRQKAIKACLKGRPEKYVFWLEQSSSFRYLIHKEIAQTRWGS